jgi:hypothetical protein
MTLLPEAGLLGKEIKQFLTAREAVAAPGFSRGELRTRAPRETIALSSKSIDTVNSFCRSRAAMVAIAARVLAPKPLKTPER